MKKIFITSRDSGLGDLLCNLASTYYLSRKYNGDVILDWRTAVYHHMGYSGENKSNIYSGEKKSNISNLFTSIFIQPTSIGDVNFYLPECDDVYWNMNKSLIPTIPTLYNLHKIPDNEIFEKKKWIENIIGENTYIKNEQRIREGNRVFPETQHSKFDIISSDGKILEKFIYHEFLEKFSIQPIIKNKIDKIFNEHFLNNNVVGIHMRYGNTKQKEPGHRIFPENGEHWVSDNEIVNTIKQKVEKLNIGNVKYFISCDNERINDLLLKTISNSFCYLNKYPSNGQTIHVNDGNNQIELIQSSFIDMYLLTKCHRLIYTKDSVYTEWPLSLITDNCTNMTLVESIF